MEINSQEEVAAAENHRIEVEINPQEEAVKSALREAIALAIAAVVATEPEIAQANPIARDSPLRITS